MSTADPNDFSGSVLPSEPAPVGLRGLDPGELLARGLQTVRPSGGRDAWEPPTPEELNRLLPEYNIESLIGRGGMGAIYKGTQVILDRPVAIKLLPVEIAADEQFVARFHREARTLARLQHSRIITIHDFGQTAEGHLYFVMEYIDGTNLREILRGPGLSPEQALLVTGQICDALQTAHAQGVIHRDIKPENILVTKDGYVKLADFGLSRPMQMEDVSALTGTNIIMGTADYMAPEQREGQVDQRADIFALGVTLYEMLTGKPPRGAFEPASSRMRGMRLDARIDQVVLKALQSEPSRRYQRVSEMKTDVDRIRDTPLPPQSGALQSPAQEPVVRSKMRLVGIAIMAPILGLFILVHFSRRAHSPSSIKNALSSTDSKLMRAPPLVDGSARSIFNGKDLTGWKTMNDSWIVKDGAITWKPSDKSACIVWDGGVVSDFEFHCKFRYLPGLDKKWWQCGIRFRGRILRPDNLWITGYQAEIQTNFGNTGGFYDPRHLLIPHGESVVIVDSGEKAQPIASFVTGAVCNLDKLRSSIRLDGWNDYRIVAVGNRVQFFLNGIPSVDLTDQTSASWSLADPQLAGVTSATLSSGVLGFTPGPAQFKDITLKQITSKQSPPRSYPLPVDPPVRAGGVHGGYLKKESVALKAGGVKAENFPSMDGDDPNGVFSSKPVYFDIRSGTEIHYKVDSLTPLTELTYTGAGQWGFRIEIRDLKGGLIVSSGPYNRGYPVNVIRMPLPNLTHFQVVLITNQGDWLLVEDLHFGSALPGSGAPPARVAARKRAPATVRSPNGSEAHSPPIQMTAGDEALANARGAPVANSVPALARTGYDSAAKPAGRRTFGSSQEEALLGHDWSWDTVKENGSRMTIQFLEDGRVSAGWNWQWLPKANGDLVVDCFFEDHQHLYLKFDKQFSEFEACGEQGDCQVRGRRLGKVGAMPMDATKDAPFENSLGMKFVPIAGTNVLFSIWDTRVQDYEECARAKKIKRKKPNFEQGPTEPVVEVTWEDAEAFCAWLGIKEGRAYRLPTDAEWSIAVGLGAERGATPKEKSANGPAAVFPYGGKWPPPPGAGNYADETAKKARSGLRYLNGYDDGYAYTSPVGSFPGNRLGLYDMGGNVWQWCEDWYDETHEFRTLRGGSWCGTEPDRLRSSFRCNGHPAVRSRLSGFRCVLALSGG